MDAPSVLCLLAAPPVARPPNGLVLAGSVLMAASVAGLLLWALRVVTAPRNDHLLPTQRERDRRRLLRLRSWAYRRFEPVVDQLAAFFRANAPGAVESLRRDLVLVEPPRPRHPDERWEPDEYLAVKQVEAGLVGIGAGLAFAVAVDPLVGLGVAGLLAWAGPRVLVSSVRDRAERYRAEVRSRIPMTIDLIGLMLEASATLPQCVEAVTRENEGHPVGDLFAVLGDSIRRNVPRDEALRRMAEMVDDPDVNELVFTLTATGETSGLRDILRSMATPMRVRRVQHLEQASERAKVNITFPGMVIMAGCLLIVLALFLLPAGQP